MANKVTGKKWVGINNSNKATVLRYENFRLKVQRKSVQTIRNEANTLRKLARLLRKKEFKDATEQDLLSFFENKKIVKSDNSRDLYGAHIIKFYNWLLELKRKKRPDIMEWFEYQTASQRQKKYDPNRKEKRFITRKEYDALQKWTVDQQEKALWETLYLSGARPSEICSMRIDSLKELEGGYEITVYDSKTKPRNIPLVEHPEHLLRWIEHHPYQDDKQHALWLSKSTRKMNNPMVADVVNVKLKKAIERAGIKTTITPHCFRKTRATIMFTQKSKDDGLIFTDKEISLHFGWQLASVPLRREEYDLTNQDDLRKKVFGNGSKAPSYDVIKAEKEKLETRYGNRIKDLEKLNSHWINNVTNLEHRMNDMIHEKEREEEQAEITRKMNKEHTKKFAKENTEKYEKVLELANALKDLGITI